MNRKTFWIMVSVAFAFLVLNHVLEFARGFAPPAPAVGASSRVQSVDGGIANEGYQQIVNPAAATALTIPAGSNCAMIQAEGAQIRWRDDGTNPAAGVGMYIPAGSSIWYVGDLTKFKVINDGGAATVDVAFYYSG